MEDNAVVTTGIPDPNEIDYEKSKSNLLDFITTTKPGYEVNWHHELICKELDDFLTDPSRDRLMIFVGPRRGKSEIVSRRLPAYVLGRWPNTNLMLASYGAELASSMNRDVQRIIDDETYREIFPNTRLNSRNVVTSSQHNYVRTADVFEVVDHTGKMVTAGVSGSLTGKGADLFIIDDPHKDMKEATSPTIQKAAVDWFDSVVSTRLSKKGKVIVMSTRWAMGDLAGQLIDRMKKSDDVDQWEIICLPELFELTEFTHPDDPREDGEPLWPKWFPKSKTQKLKAASSYVFNALFQQRPFEEGGSVVKRDWFNYYEMMPEEFDYIKISLDCTFKNAGGNDYVVIMPIGVVGSKKYILPKVIRERLSFTETLKALANVIKNYPNYQEVIIEDKANGPAVIDTIKDKVRAIYAYNPKSSKEARFSSAAPDIQAGDVYLPDPLVYPEAKRWVSAFLDEVTIFPKAKNDDFCDALSQALIRCRDGFSWVDKLSQADLDEDDTAAFISRVFGV